MKKINLIIVFSCFALLIVGYEFYNRVEAYTKAKSDIGGVIVECKGKYVINDYHSSQQEYVIETDKGVYNICGLNWETPIIYAAFEPSKMYKIYTCQSLNFAYTASIVEASACSKK